MKLTGEVALEHATENGFLLSVDSDALADETIHYVPAAEALEVADGYAERIWIEIDVCGGE